MATSQDEHPGIRMNKSVCFRDFAVDRLEDADSPMAPADLADEYGCSNGHARNMLSELLSEGEVARVGRGEYEAPVADEADSGTDVLAGVEADIRESGAAIEDTESEEMDAGSDASGNGFRGDGRVRSDDSDGTGGDQEGSTMVTDEEYARQDPLVEDVDDQEESDDQEEVVVEETETSSFGLPWEAVILVVAVGAVVFWLWYRSSSTGSDEQDRQGAIGGRDDLLG